jgi:hypothetical protein
MRLFEVTGTSITAVFLGLVISSLSSGAVRSAEPTGCANGAIDPETRPVYTGTVELVSSGGEDRMGWQCFFHTTADFLGANVTIRTPSGETAPYSFAGVGANRDTKPGYALIGVDFYPTCKPYCTAYNPGKLTATYEIDFKPQGKQPETAA